MHATNFLSFSLEQWTMLTFLMEKRKKENFLIIGEMGPWNFANAISS